MVRRPEFLLPDRVRCPEMGEDSDKRDEYYECEADDRQPVVAKPSPRVHPEARLSSRLAEVGGECEVIGLREVGRRDHQYLILGSSSG